MQRSREWYLKRCGHVTGSGVKKVLASGRGGGDSRQRDAYMRQLVAEIITGEPQDYSLESNAMKLGVEYEPLARDFYVQTKNPVVEEDFIVHHRLGNCGYSPDGLVGDDGIIEIKCPLPPQHLETIRIGVVPSEHMPQIMWGLACTGRKWCDFISYCPNVPSRLGGFIVRVNRNEEWIQEIESRVVSFLNTVYERVAELQKL